jgi:1-aminocyclopropane-1-carboxylate deaminase/D-cysteine desulfhydrase-like pyridoxal-dependent ACC family enzyme
MPPRSRAYRHFNSAPDESNNDLSHTWSTQSQIPTQTLSLTRAFFDKNAQLFPFVPYTKPDLMKRSKKSGGEKISQPALSPDPSTSSQTTSLTHPPPMINPPHRTPEQFDEYLSSLKISVKRLDLVHNEISGNKWFKLKHNLLPYLDTPKKPIILTLGGAFSNHIAATAAASSLGGFQSIGLVRGEELAAAQDLNHTLSTAVNKHGMFPIYTDRYTYQHRNHKEFNIKLEAQLRNGKALFNISKVDKDHFDNFHKIATTLDPNHDDFCIPLYYRNDIDYNPLWSSLGLKMENSSNFIDDVNHHDNDLIIIPEGGTNEAALKGTSEILTPQDFDKYTHIATAVGTGGTLGGLVQKKLLYHHKTQIRPRGGAQIIGFAAVPPRETNLEQIHAFLDNYQQNIGHQIFTDYSRLYQIDGKYLGKGYAFQSEELKSFIEHFERSNLVKNDDNNADSKVKCLSHCGIKLEPVYTGKMFYGVFDMIFQQKFEPNSHILLIHTGGLQGNYGYSN